MPIANCKHWKRGYCARGQACRFLHPAHVPQTGARRAKRNEAVLTPRAPSGIAAATGPGLPVHNPCLAPPVSRPFPEFLFTPLHYQCRADFDRDLFDLDLLTINPFALDEDPFHSAQDLFALTEPEMPLAPPFVFVDTDDIDLDVDLDLLDSDFDLELGLGLDLAGAFDSPSSSADSSAFDSPSLSDSSADDVVASADKSRGVVEPACTTNSPIRPGVVQEAGDARTYDIARGKAAAVDATCTGAGCEADDGAVGDKEVQVRADDEQASPPRSNGEAWHASEPHGCAVLAWDGPVFARRN